MNDLQCLQKIRDREQHGIAPEHPVSTDEMDSDVRFLLGVIAGLGGHIGSGGIRLGDLAADAARLPPRRKRCTRCHGEGHRPQCTGDSYEEPCEACNGTGYQEAGE